MTPHQITSTTSSSNTFLMETIDIESGVEDGICERRCKLVLKISAIIFVIFFIVVVLLIIISIFYIKKTNAFAFDKEYNDNLD